ncbi:MAG: HAMP domain-containing sensor histidine kinase [Clostridia bacterium]
MQKSLFTKYLIMTMSIVLTSFVVLCVFVMFFFYTQKKTETERLLSENVYSVSDFAKNYVLQTPSSKTDLSVNSIAVNILLDVLSSNIDADIFITDLDGNRFAGAYANSESHGEALISKTIVDKATAGFYTSSDDLGGFYFSDQYTVGIPFTVIDVDTNQEVVVGAIFASTSIADTFGYLFSMFQVFLIAMLITLIISFILVWLFTYRMVRPLRRMSIATKTFGAGDFAVRVPVESEDEIGQLSLAFNNMANSLSNSEGMRRSFIANVSHELKTPMTTIGGFIDGILDGTIPPQRQNQYLKIVSIEIKRLSRLVKSMLDLSRIDSGEMKINMVKFDLTATVFNTLLTFEQKIEEKSLDITGLEDAPPMMIDGDQDLLHQVVYNLIENAVKFTPEKGYISFVFTDSFDRVALSIKNSGQGIAPEDLPMIFDKFYKTDKSRSQDKNGMGLGLYLVKTIINLHGGDITVQSAVDNFSNFEFYLPKTIVKKSKNIENDVINIPPNEIIQDID